MSEFYKKKGANPHLWKSFNPSLILVISDGNIVGSGVVSGSLVGAYVKGCAHVDGLCSASV